jgi:hypothetical protein
VEKRAAQPEEAGQLGRKHSSFIIVGAVGQVTAVPLLAFLCLRTANRRSFLPVYLEFSPSQGCRPGLLGTCSPQYLAQGRVKLHPMGPFALPRTAISILPVRGMTRYSIVGRRNPHRSVQSAVLPSSRQAWPRRHRRYRTSPPSPRLTRQTWRAAVPSPMALTRHTAGQHERATRRTWNTRPNREVA